MKFDKTSTNLIGVRSLHNTHLVEKEGDADLHRVLCPSRQRRRGKIMKLSRLCSASGMVFLTLLMMLVSSGALQASPRHLIFYHPPYKDAAETISSFVNARGIETEIIPTTDTIFFNPIIFPVESYVADPEGTDTKWSTYWNDLRALETEYVIQEPRRLMTHIQEMDTHVYYGDQYKFVEYITLLGNTLEIPPSTLTENNWVLPPDIWDNAPVPLNIGGIEVEVPEGTDPTEIEIVNKDDAVYGMATDFYYSLSNSEDLLPDYAISRIPVVMTDPASEYDSLALTLGDSAIVSALPFFSAFRSSGPGDLQGANLAFYLTKEPGFIPLFRYYRIVQDNTGIGSITSVDGDVKFIITDIEDAYASIGSTLFPFLAINQSPDSDPITNLGGLAFYTHDEFQTTSGNLYDAQEVRTLNDRWVLADQKNLEPTLTVFAEIGNGTSLTVRSQNESNNPFATKHATLTTFNTNITNGTGTYVLVSKTDNRIHIMASYTGTATGGTITLSSVAGDTADGDENYELEIYDYSTMNAAYTGNVNSISYVKPGPFRFDNEERTSRLASAGYLQMLTTSANNMATKFKNWSDYVWTTKAGDPAFFNNALLVSRGGQQRWDFVQEAVMTNFINTVDSSNSNSSLFNGFQLFKFFESNDGNIPTSSTNTTDLRGRPVTPFLDIETKIVATKDLNGTQNITPANSVVLVTNDDGFAEMTLQAGTAAEDLVLAVDPSFNTNLSPQNPVNYTVASPSSSANTLAFVGGYDFPTTSTSNIIIHARDLNDQLVTGDSSRVYLTIKSPSGTAEFGSVLSGNEITGFRTSDNSQIALDLSNSTGTTASGCAIIQVRNPTAETAVISTTNGGGFSLGSSGNLTDPAPLNLTSYVPTAGGQGARVVFTRSGSFSGNNSQTVARLHVYDANGQIVKDNFAVRVFISLIPADLIQRMFNKGIVMVNDDWRFIWDKNTGWTTADFSKGTTAATASTNPLLPLMITGGDAGYSNNYDFDAIESQYGNYYAAAALNYYISSSDYGGIIGYIGRYGGMPIFEESALGLEMNEGVWSNAIFTHSPLRNRHVLAREAMKEYSSGAQSKIASLWQESITGFLDYIVENDSTISNRQDAAAQNIRLLESWGALGVAALELPVHKQWVSSGGNLTEANEVPKPAVSIISDGIRSTDAYDRYGVQVIEVESGSSVSVKIQVNNENDFPSPSKTFGKFRYTLCSVPLIQPYTDQFQYHSRISEIDFLTAASLTEVMLTSDTGDDASSKTYTFYDSWSRDSSSNLLRGPSLYMIRVEALEPQKTGNFNTTGAQYTKESRLFFRIVNKFTVKSGTQILLVNNTDHDPYQLKNFELNYVPATGVRYYEDALDNYQYSRGTLTYSSTSSQQSTFTIDDDSVSNVTKRLAVGDKIRLLSNVDNLFTDWYRVADLTSTTVVVEDTNSDFSTKTSISGNASEFSAVNYLAQRAYTEGYSTLTYAYAGNLNVASGEPKVESVSVTLPSANYLNFENVVRAGDFFKFLDERTYMRISNVSAASGSTYTLTFGTPSVSNISYTTNTLYHYYTDSLVWGTNAHFSSNLLTSAANMTTNGSYAIYPPSPSDSTEPNYLYQTWNVHNYNTSNNMGQGVHGDVSSTVLASFAEGDSSGLRHKAVVWANEGAYTFGITKNRDSSLGDVVNETAAMMGNAIYYLSEGDKNRISTFLESGGRLMTGGQFLIPDEHGFYNKIGVTTNVNNSEIFSIGRVSEDPISDPFENVVALDEGLTEATQTTVDNESNKITTEPTVLNVTEDGEGIPFFYYTSGSLDFNDNIAAVRTSGGPAFRPFASIFMGFDFASLNPSGTRSIFRPTSDSPVKGRNLLMKNSIDWLRDPTRTSTEQAVEVTYHARELDGSVTPIVLKKVNDKFRVNTQLHVDNGLTGGVGINTQLIFSVTGGTIYTSTSYNWSLSSIGSFGSVSPTIVKDGGEADNEDNHKMIYTSGDSTEASDVLRLLAPDGTIVNINIEPEVIPLTLTIVNDDATVINDETVNLGGRTVRFNAFGGNGAGSYVFTLLPGDPVFTHSSLMVSGASFADYTLPLAAPLSDKTSVIIQVDSGDQTSSAFLTIEPAVQFVDDTAFAVVDGSAGHIDVLGGLDPRTFTANPETFVTLTPDTDTKGVTFEITDPSVASLNPNDPTEVTLTVESIGTVDTALALLYAAPKLSYRPSGTKSFTEVLSDTAKLPIPDSQNVEFRAEGGIGSFLWEIEGKTSTFQGVFHTTDGSDYSQIGATWSTDFVPNVSQSEVNVSLSGNAGTVNLSLLSGGSKKNYALSFVVPIDITLHTGGGNTSILPGRIIELSLSGGSGPYTYSMSPSNLGGGFTLDSSGTGLTETLSVQNETTRVFFVAGSIEQTGVINVTDSNNNPAVPLQLEVTNTPGSSVTIDTSGNTTGVTGVGGGATPLIQTGAPIGPTVTTGGGCLLKKD